VPREGGKREYSKVVITNSVAAPATVGEKCLSYATRKGKAIKHADTQARKPAIYGRYFLQAGCTVEDGISVTDDEQLRWNFPVGSVWRLICYIYVVTCF
jgi:hypothetical protein